MIGRRGKTNTEMAETRHRLIIRIGAQVDAFMTFFGRIPSAFLGDFSARYFVFS
jgi:hypothetical protein